jgi:hypothetical protein
MTLLDRVEPETDALRTDRYLEALIRSGERGASTAPFDPELDPGLRLAAERLAGSLVRVHPSFRFEEHLAARLAEAAPKLRLPVAAGGDAGDRSRHRATDPIGLGPLDPADLADPAGAPAAFRLVGHSLLIGGALTSAAISLTGAAIVAWRRNHARALAAAALPAPASGSEEARPI